MKFLDFLSEKTETGKIIVVYGGGFQPFHAGHMSSYEQAKHAFPNADFYVASSNDVKVRPIPFADKKFLAHQAGVTDEFVQVAQPVNPQEILSKYNPNKDILVLVRSERDPVNYTKKDGSPAYYQPFKSIKDSKPFNPKSGHGYVFVTKKKVFKIGDKEVYSGSQVREMYSKADNKGRRNIIHDLYPKASDPIKVKKLLDKHIGGKIKESIDQHFEELLIEGVHDKGIFKAVFLGGGPGSGKDFVLDKTLAGHGLTEINSDKALEFLMDKNNLDMRMPDNEKEARNVVRSKAKNMTELKQKLALLGRNGLIINGTGDDVEKISRIKERLEDLGYETAMIMVNTADEVSKARNVERGQRGGRTVPEDIRKEKWDSVQRSRPEHAKMFGQNYIEFDNSEDLRNAPPEVVDAKKKEMDGIFKTIQKFVTKPPKNLSASNWVADQLQRKDTFKVDTTKEYTPHQDSKAAEQAKQMGLDYYGFGRYGKNGKVTHRSIHDKLVDVQKLQPTVTKKKSLKESYNLSDSGALNMLLLGNRIQEYELENFVENKQPKYLSDSSGNVRVFMLRRAAAEEAHQKNGVVIPFKNGYVVKLKEEFHNVDQVFEEFISGFGGADYQSRTSGSSTTSTFLTEAKTTHSKTKTSTSTTKESFVNAARKKITLSEIRKRQEESLIESIDKGIEPGLSMAGAGESPARDMGEKWKKKTGKSSPVVETIGATGDDVLNSMSDQKDGELRRKGIRLSTFKSRNPIG